jgi:hypothetical protein
MLESCREVTFSQMVKARGDIPVARAERDAKASPEWTEYVKKMVEARTAANLKKVQLAFIRMKLMEATSMEATARVFPESLSASRMEIAFAETCRRRHPCRTSGAADPLRRARPAQRVLRSETQARCTTSQIHGA